LHFQYDATGTYRQDHRVFRANIESGGDRGENSLSLSISELSQGKIELKLDKGSRRRITLTSITCDPRSLLVFEQGKSIPPVVVGTLVTDSTEDHEVLEGMLFVLPPRNNVCLLERCILAAAGTSMSAFDHQHAFNTSWDFRSIQGHKQLSAFSIANKAFGTAS
jgi:hypothetical protein